MSLIDITCIGNAIVDIIARCDDDFLEQNGIIKGAMNLIDSERAELLYDRMGPAIEASGGSACNTAAGAAGFGAKTALFAKVSKDQLGEIFTHDIRAIGTEFKSTPLEGHPPTARSMIFVTPDAERSMNTYLGACVEIGPEDIDEQVVANSKITYFEGYLWDPPRAKDAIRLAADIAHKNGRLVAGSLSDSFCVDRYRDEFLELIRSKTVDIVFANEDEVKSLYQTENFDEAIAQLAHDATLATVTLGAKGAIVMRAQERWSVAGHDVDKVVDTTGAGDLYAAGFLYGYTQDKDLETCAKLGNFIAAQVIQQIGPRLQDNIPELLKNSGLLAG